MNILVVDYDSKSRMDALELEGHIHVAAGIREAVALASLDRLDLVVSAVQLPDGTCVDLFAELHRKGSQARFVVLLGPDQRVDRSRIPRGHKLTIVSAPFDREEILHIAYEHAPTKATVPPPLRVCRILVIDDNEEHIDNIRKWLHHDVVAVGNLPSAFEALDDTAFDAIACTLRMPSGKNSSASATGTIEELVRHTTLPIVAMSPIDTDGPEAVRAGAHEFIQSFNYARLASALDLAMERARFVQELTRRSMTDDRTGLWDWKGSRAAIAEAIADVRSNPEGHPQFGVLMIDLDHFKLINDHHGHNAGDVLITHFARLLKDNMRKTDVVCRYGGDEFVVVLKSAKSAEEAQHIAQRLRTSLMTPMQLDRVHWTPSCSIGIAMYPDHGTTVDQLFESAEHAAYVSKRNGRGQLIVFTHEMRLGIDRKRMVERALKRDVTTMRGFSLLYQPQFDKHGRLITAEALIRWETEGQQVCPLSFIASLERSGLIRQVGRWVLNQALRQLVAFRKAGIWLDLISINVSARELEDPRFFTSLREKTKAYGLEPRDIGLELTESVFLREDPAIVAEMKRLHEEGYNWKLDDFGTGFSSINYLQRLPFSVLKLDKNLVQSSSSELIFGLVQLSHSLGMEVVAEGVETEELYTELLDKGVDRFQGYLLGRPMTGADFIQRFTPAPNGSATHLPNPG